MKKLLTLIFTIACLYAKAQTTEGESYSSKALTIGPEFNATVKSIYKYGYGAAAKVEWPITSEAEVTLSAAYNRYFYKNSDGYSSAWPPAVFIPVKLGSRFFFVDKVYGDLDLGASIGTNYDKQAAFIYEFGVGYILPAGKHSGLDVGIRYERWGKTVLKQAVLKVAYRFNW
ncbi:hypothetical protein [Mucilaginibacter gilvus]|uniref:Outer membrane protein beta-barrel domain-containing protein n=1 Tax=Mucilaginibacter gilvus TaxID=2305909 RepID=A0A3S3UTA8_9SPHI|nr:hypothetical protein [Mucilaginibacter gilvus]RWY53935.1 hypothetical protein EPL05_07715 [Mucilaginibacter gilvus]